MRANLENPSVLFRAHSGWERLSTPGCAIARSMWRSALSRGHAPLAPAAVSRAAWPGRFPRCPSAGGIPDATPSLCVGALGVSVGAHMPFPRRCGLCRNFRCTSCPWCPIGLGTSLCSCLSLAMAAVATKNTAVDGRERSRIIEKRGIVGLVIKRTSDSSHRNRELETGTRSTLLEFAILGQREERCRHLGGRSSAKGACHPRALKERARLLVSMGLPMDMELCRESPADSGASAIGGVSAVLPLCACRVA